MSPVPDPDWVEPERGLGEPAARDDRPGRIRLENVFFGCPLDSDEKDDSIREKLDLLGALDVVADPYEAVMNLVRAEVDASRFRELGSLEVPDWLRPIPGNAAKDRIDPGQFTAFIDQDGCRGFAKVAGDLVADHIWPDRPCLIGVDHCLTGGVFKTLSEKYGAGDLSLIVLDAHLDAQPTSLVARAIQYDLDNNPKSLYSAHDPFLRNRKDSFNASSFLHFLIQEGALDPENLLVAGIADYPPKTAFRIKDPRIRDYVRIWSGLKSDGARILTREDLVKQPEKTRRQLSRIQTPYVYVSIDLDVGAENALSGVRFRDRSGISEKQLVKLVTQIRQLFNQGPKLVGLDIVEFNPRRAGKDRTYRIAVDLIKILLFNG